MKNYIELLDKANSFCQEALKSEDINDHIVGLKKIEILVFERKSEIKKYRDFAEGIALKTYLFDWDRMKPIAEILNEMEEHNESHPEAACFQVHDIYRHLMPSDIADEIGGLVDLIQTTLFNSPDW